MSTRVEENDGLILNKHINSIDIKSFANSISTIKVSSNIDLALLIEALYELDTMIGMQKFKKMVMNQILYLMVFKRTSNKHPMMHTLITGGPGRGKTTVAKILARIWASMGIIGSSKKDNSHIKLAPDMTNMMKTNDMELDTSKMINLIMVAGTIDNHWENITKVEKSIKSQLKQVKTLVNKSCDTKTTYATRKILNEVSKSISEITIRTKHISDIALKGALTSGKKQEDSSELSEKPYVLAARGDFIGQWVGSTPNKTKQFLEKNRGKVIIIDEAYSLFPKDGDSFSMEALTIINTYASEYPEDYIFIFAGYEDMIQEGILTAQPGLKRRIKWHFSIENYNSTDLANIFLSQCTKEDITVNIKFKTMVEIFQRNTSYFPNFGGSTESLIHYCCMAYCRKNSYKLFNDEKLTFSVNEDILHDGISQLKDNTTANNNTHHNMMFT